MATQYDIDDVNIKIQPADGTDNTIDGTINPTKISADGFGITPESEHTVIEGLKGEHGFNIDPSTQATATISLLSISPEIEDFREIWKNDLIVKVEITSEDQEAVGFSSKKIKHAMITTPPEFTTDEEEAPAVEFEFVGYGFDEN